MASALVDPFASLGISLWLIVLISIWEVIWTGIAMWRAAQRKHMLWFVVFLIVNLLAIPEILYIFLFSKKSGSKRKR